MAKIIKFSERFNTMEDKKVEELIREISDSVVKGDNVGICWDRKNKRFYISDANDENVVESSEMIVKGLKYAVETYFKSRDLDVKIDKRTAEIFLSSVYKDWDNISEKDKDAIIVEFLLNVYSYKAKKEHGLIEETVQIYEDFIKKTEEIATNLRKEIAYKTLLKNKEEIAKIILANSNLDN